MRTVICAATATIFLGLGMALLLQATQASSESHNATLEQTRPPSESLEATLEPTPTPSELQPILKAHYAIAAAPDDVSAVTMPIAYRQVRTVSIIEPTEAAPKNPAGTTCRDLSDGLPRRSKLRPVPPWRRTARRPRRTPRRLRLLRT